jgi:hypothetical protein
MTATVKYWIATYEGTVEVTCDPDDDNEMIIARAKCKLRRTAGTFPYGAESWKVISRTE